jgi:hypothetical protein
LLVVSCSSSDRTGPSGGSSPTGDPDLWKEGSGEPYPYLKPIPPLAATSLDGAYARTLTLADGATEAIPCRRCAPYRFNTGRAVLEFREGRYSVDHPAAAFRSLGHYVVRGSRVELFNDPHCARVRGVYRWTLQGSTLTLEVIDDPCPYDDLRATYISAQPWSTAQAG